MSALDAMRAKLEALLQVQFAEREAFFEAHLAALVEAWPEMERARLEALELEEALTDLEARGVPRCAVSATRTSNRALKLSAVAIDPSGFHCTVDPVRWSLKERWRWPS